jgi:hypothetical protein
MGLVPLSATDPGRKMRDAVGTDQPQLTTAKADCVQASRGNSGLNCDLAAKLRLEATSALARNLKTGTDCLSPLAVRQIIQVADEDVMGSLTAVCRLDREVHELSTTHPSGDPIEQMESVVHMYEEEMLEWERTRSVHRNPDADPDPAREPTGQKLVEALERTLAEDEAAESPPLRLEDTAWTRQVLRQATKVLCLAEEVCNTATKEGWQPCAYNIYRWRMEQEVGYLFVCFGGPDEDEAVVRDPRKARMWLTKSHEKLERAKKRIGSHLRKASGLQLPRFCRHDGPPGESRPCDMQASASIQRACRAWEANPERLWEVCGECLEAADRSARGKTLARKNGGGPAWTPAADSEFSPDLISSGEDSDSSDTDSEDSDSSETNVEDSNPSETDAEDLDPFTTDTDSSDLSTTDTEDSDSSAADSGYEWPSSTDTGEETLPSAPPLEEDDAELEEIIAGLRGRALQQVRRYVAVLARMRRDLTPSARIHMIKELGWHLGSNHETRGAGRDGNGPEPTWLLEGTGWIMSKLATIKEQRHQARMERFRAMQERMAMLDDGLASAKEQLAEKREAELKARAKENERRLPVITAQLGLLWHEVTGSGRPAPSEMQLTTTGTEMTAEEHVVTAETHLRYAEGHLQPSEEHLADAEVHLKLVKAHLAVLEPAEQTEVSLSETIPPPTPRMPTKETGALPTAPRKMPTRRAKMASAAKEKDSTDEPEVVFVSRGRASSKGAKMAPPP